MSYCPSHDWDRYCWANDLPEECPVCGEPNADEDGNLVCEDPAFCSTACRDKHLAEARKADEAEARHEAEMDALEGELAKLREEWRALETEDGMSVAADLAYDTARERSR